MPAFQPFGQSLNFNTRFHPVTRFLTSLWPDTTPLPQYVSKSKRKKKKAKGAALVVVHDVEYMPERDELAVSSSNYTISVWAVKNNACSWVTNMSNAVMQTLLLWVPSFTKVGELVSVGSDHALYVWDMHNRELVRVLAGHTDHITHVTALEDLRVVASCSIDMTVCIWDLETYACKSRIRPGSICKYSSYAGFHK